jgi:hypothetical protein
MSGSSMFQIGTYGGMVSPYNIPGGRQDAATWIDSNNNLWLFGGWGYAATGSYGKNDISKLTK